MLLNICRKHLKRLKNLNLKLFKVKRRKKNILNLDHQVIFLNKLSTFVLFDTVFQYNYRPDLYQLNRQQVESIEADYFQLILQP